MIGIYEKLISMATLAGIFFSIISIFGFFKCQTKTSIKKIVLVAFSVFLIIGQILFINSFLQIGGDQFLAFSPVFRGYFLFLIFQSC
jgi:hypothetical protein